MRAQAEIIYGRWCDWPAQASSEIPASIEDEGALYDIRPRQKTYQMASSCGGSTVCGTKCEEILAMPSETGRKLMVQGGKRNVSLSKMVERAK
jgi:hypothetical protein